MGTLCLVGCPSPDSRPHVPRASSRDVLDPVLQDLCRLPCRALPWRGTLCMSEWPSPEGLTPHLCRALPHPVALPSRETTRICSTPRSLRTHSLRLLLPVHGHLRPSHPVLATAHRRRPTATTKPVWRSTPEHPSQHAVEHPLQKPVAFAWPVRWHPPHRCSSKATPIHRNMVVRLDCTAKHRMLVGRCRTQIHGNRSHTHRT